MSIRIRIAACTRGLMVLAGFSLCLVAQPAQAAQAIVITNPGTIQYGVQGNLVYLRNLSTYDSSWLPCCYNYWIDLTTPGGQAMFSALLAHKLSGKQLSLYKTDPTTAGPIEIVGDF